MTKTARHDETQDSHGKAESMGYLTLQVPQSLLDDLSEIARGDERSRSGLVRRVLGAYVEAEKAKRAA